MQSLDRFNLVILGIFGAADYGKGLIDATSSFDVKSVLDRDIANLNKWFSCSKLYLNTLLSEVIITCYMSICVWKI